MDISHIHYRAGYKYQLARPYTIQTPFLTLTATTHWLTLTPDGLLTIAADYAWDGPSGPTKDTKGIMRASLVHDALYQLIRLGYLPASTRAAADNLYKQLADEDTPRKKGWLGALQEAWNDLRGRTHYTALRVGGQGSALPSAERPELTAP